MQDDARWNQSLNDVEKALSRALSDTDAALTLRAEQPADADLLTDLYTEFRWQELLQVPWPDEAKRAFLAEQCRLQHDHYRKHYTCARFWVLCEHGAVIGRLYLHRSPREFRLMDIMLFERHRGRGLGRVLIDTLLGECRRLALPVSLHVERENPAKDFYERRGFQLDEDRGTYLFMVWKPAQASVAALSEQA